MIEMALRGHYKAQGYEFPDEKPAKPQVDLGAKLRALHKKQQARKTG